MWHCAYVAEFYVAFEGFSTQLTMGKAGKPRGKMSSYAFFVQTCREEHKKKHPGEQVVFAEFSKKCSEKWKVRMISSCQLSQSDHVSLTWFDILCLQE